jgi:hypothetical protein
MNPTGCRTVMAQQTMARTTFAKEGNEVPTTERISWSHHAAYSYRGASNDGTGRLTVRRDQRCDANT